MLSLEGVNLMQVNQTKAGRIDDEVGIFDDANTMAGWTLRDTIKTGTQRLRQ